MDDLIELTPPRTSRIDGMELSWDDRVLRPRPWTRLQSQWALELHPHLPPGPLLELCCGVGHIGLLTARDTGREAILVDADAVACDHARTNARRAALPVAVRVVEHRIDGRRIPASPRSVPLVLADPPYLCSSDLDGHHQDPAAAVDGGDDGLDLVSTVLRTAAAHLGADGVCLLQLRGAGQAHAVSARLARDWQDIPLRPAGLRELDDERAVQLLVRRPSSTA